MAKWTFKQIEPQPARGVLKEGMWESPEWLMEEKYDGDRRIVQFCDDGVPRFTGRRKSVKDGLFVEKTANLPHLLDAGAVMPGTVLDGEIVWPGKTEGGGSKYVTAIMGSSSLEAIKKQQESGRWLNYVVFDCLFFSGRDIRDESLLSRRTVAKYVVEVWHRMHVQLAKLHHTDKRAWYDQIIARGGEGAILKHADHRYGDKTGWVKVKAEATADVVIMGFVPAKEMSKKADGKVSMTKYAKAGLIGAIQCGQYTRKSGLLVEVATVSGIDDALRQRMTVWGDRRYKGLVIEIKHNGQEPTGRFRHPRFVRFRPDKNPEDCVGWRGER